MKKRIIIILSVALVFIIAVGTVTGIILFNKFAKANAGEITIKEKNAAHIRQEGEDYYLDNRVLLTAKEDTSKAQIEELVQPYRGKVVGRIELTNDYQIEFDKAYSLGNH